MKGTQLEATNSLFSIFLSLWWFSKWFNLFQWGVAGTEQTLSLQQTTRMNCAFNLKLRREEWKKYSLSEKNHEKQKSERLQQKNEKNKKNRNLRRHKGSEGKKSSHCWWISGQEVCLVSELFWQRSLLFKHNDGCEQNGTLPLRVSKLYFGFWQNSFIFKNSYSLQKLLFPEFGCIVDQERKKKWK